MSWGPEPPGAGSGGTCCATKDVLYTVLRPPKLGKRVVSFFMLGLDPRFAAVHHWHTPGHQGEPRGQRSVSRNTRAAPGGGERAVQPLRCAAAKASRPSAVVGLRLLPRGGRHGEKGHDRPSHLPGLWGRVWLRGRGPCTRSSSFLNAVELCRRRVRLGVHLPAAASVSANRSTCGRIACPWCAARAGKRGATRGGRAGSEAMAFQWTCALAAAAARVRSCFIRGTDPRRHRRL